MREDPDEMDDCTTLGAGFWGEPRNPIPKRVLGQAHDNVKEMREDPASEVLAGERAWWDKPNHAVLKAPCTPHTYIHTPCTQR